MSPAVGTGATVLQPVKTGTTVSPPVGTGATASQAVGTGTTVSQPARTGTTASQVVNNATTTPQPVQTGTTMPQMVATGTTVSQAVVTESTASQAVRTGTTISQIVGTGTTASQADRTGTTVSQPVGTGTTVSQPVGTGTTVSTQTDTRSTTSGPIGTRTITQLLTGSANTRPTQPTKTSTDSDKLTTSRSLPDNVLPFVATLAGLAFTPALANPNSPRRQELEQQLKNSFISLLNNTIYNDTIENVTINDVTGEVGEPARVTYTIHTRHGSGVTGEELEQAMQAAQDSSHPNINLPSVCYLGGSGPCASTTTAAPMSTIGPTKTFNFRVELEGRNFSDALNNKSSQTFTQASTQLLESLKSYLNSTPHANVIDDVTVRSFQDGDPMTAIFTVKTTPGSQVTGGQLEEALRAANKFDDPLDIDLPTT
ncbi:mucin-19-like [Branchiostoma floridae]|uniref:Mucin-19-like n=1 Tax=Branchiostoma floridae TaxID=7739 RepID=A0A9J7HXA2_BRAFL|nr:mucin-19-like [Branchiostoma floridae]